MRRAGVEEACVADKKAQLRESRADGADPWVMIYSDGLPELLARRGPDAALGEAEAAERRRRFWSTRSRR